jgi:hypothetical protein
MELAEMEEYFATHPPRCLHEFDVAPVELVGAVFDGHGEALNPVFQVRCKCGCDKGIIKGYFWVNPDNANEQVLLISPISVTCGKCGTTQELIDTGKHGYDVELGSFSCTVRGEGTHGSYQCVKCSAENMETFVRFEYSEDLFDDDFAEARGREQDLFSWFSLHGRCAQCGTTADITDFECA